jgi:hypothetical protein
MVPVSPNADVALPFLSPAPATSAAGRCRQSSRSREEGHLLVLRPPPQSRRLRRTTHAFLVRRAPPRLLLDQGDRVRKRRIVPHLLRARPRLRRSRKEGLSSPSSSLITAIEEGRPSSSVVRLLDHVDRGEVILLFLLGRPEGPLLLVRRTPPRSRRLRREDPPSSFSSCNGDRGRRILSLFAFFVVCLLGRGDQGGDPGSSSSLLSTGRLSSPLSSSASLITALDEGGSSFSSFYLPRRSRKTRRIETERPDVAETGVVPSTTPPIPTATPSDDGDGGVSGRRRWRAPSWEGRQSRAGVGGGGATGTATGTSHLAAADGEEDRRRRHRSAVLLPVPRPARRAPAASPAGRGPGRTLAAAAAAAAAAAVAAAASTVRARHGLSVGRDAVVVFLYFFLLCCTCPVARKQGWLLSNMTSINSEVRCTKSTGL